MSDSARYRDVSAKHYDSAYEQVKELQDIPFYVELAKQLGGPVLELGCGTGRVLLPIARQGIEIHGVDLSAAMLEVLQNKVAAETPQVREHVSLSPGDIRTFRSDRKYRLVTLPFRPMQHMFTLEDQIAALKTAAFHLEPQGRLAFDVFFPKFDLIVRIGEERLEMEWPSSSEPGTIVRRFVRTESLDKVNQLFTLTFIFRTYRDGNLIGEETEPLAMSYYTYPHLRALFLLAGLEVAEEYGSFAKTPLGNDSQEMIFVLQRS
jgi:SAM-dependent methyltransferase